MCAWWVHEIIRAKEMAYYGLQKVYYGLPDWTINKSNKIFSQELKEMVYYGLQGETSEARNQKLTIIN